MKIFEKIVDRLIVRAQRTPYYHLRDYMERYWLVPYGEPYLGEGCGRVSLRRPIALILQLFGIAARVHHVLTSDDARAFHDHPWNYTTIVLRGGYFEVTPEYDASGIYQGDRRVWYGPGSVIRRQAHHWHRLELPEGRTAWTLFITGKKRQAWGFLPDPKPKVYYREYLDEIERRKHVLRMVPAASKTEADHARD